MSISDEITLEIPAMKIFCGESATMSDINGISSAGFLGVTFVISTYSLGRRIFKADPLRGLPSKERAVVASSGVRNSANP
uniref:Uncharacterized protein n=1 Tax=Arundo donax TaxID=35708 RepID=A0A0A9EKB3_ARUDO